VPPQIKTDTLYLLPDAGGDPSLPLCLPWVVIELLTSVNEFISVLNARDIIPHPLRFVKPFQGKFYLF
jgi:hypothetical protein